MLTTICLIIKFFPECNEYKVLQTEDRSVHQPYNPAAACDHSLEPAWYRFQRNAGNAMANSCPRRFHCGTIVPGWLKGELPSVQEGIVSRKACFNQNRNCCYESTEAKVRNCGAFYVYYLRPAPYCQLRYCGNGRKVTKSCRSQKKNYYLGGFILHPSSQLLLLSLRVILLSTYKFLRFISMP